VWIKWTVPSWHTIVKCPADRTFAVHASLQSGASQRKAGPTDINPASAAAATAASQAQAPCSPSLVQTQGQWLAGHAVEPPICPHRDARGVSRGGAHGLLLFDQGCSSQRRSRLAQTDGAAVSAHCADLHALVSTGRGPGCGDHYRDQHRPSRCIGQRNTQHSAHVVCHSWPNSTGYAVSAPLCGQCDWRAPPSGIDQLSSHLHADRQ
jgi:hypothetical protein